jgi:hypothetical protein
MDLVGESWVHWLTAIFFGILLVLQLAFQPETLYPRSHMFRLMPAAATTTASAASSAGTALEKRGHQLGDASTVPLRRTKALPFLSVRPLPGLRHPKPWDSAVRFVQTCRFAAVVVAVLAYNCLWYWWISSLTSMIPAAYAQYPPHIQGLLVIGLLAGTLVAEFGFSGRLSDVIVERLARRNGGIRVAEMRLWLVYPAALLSAGNVVSSPFF